MVRNWPSATRAVLPSSAVYTPLRISKDEQINIYFPFPCWGGVQGRGVELAPRAGVRWLGKCALVSVIVGEFTHRVRAAGALRQVCVALGNLKLGAAVSQ